MQKSLKTQNLENTAPQTRSSKVITLILSILIALIIITALVLLTVYCVQNPEKAVIIRDILVIMLALGIIVTGVAFTILVIQLAILINLVNNEIIPIINSTKETVDTLKGTTKFVSQELVGPVIKLNSYLAGLKKLLSIFHIVKK